MPCGFWHASGRLATSTVPKRSGRLGGHSPGFGRGALLCARLCLTMSDVGREAEERRRLRAAMVICAALVVVEAAVLLVLGDDARHKPTPSVISAGTTVTTLNAPLAAPGEQARGAAFAPTTTVPRALHALRPSTPPTSLALTPAAATRPA